MKNLCLEYRRYFCVKNAENSHLNSNTHPSPWIFPCLSPPSFPSPPYDCTHRSAHRPAVQTEEEQARLAKTEAETSFRAILDSYEFRMPQVRFWGKDYFALFFVFTLNVDFHFICRGKTSGFSSLSSCGRFGSPVFTRIVFVFVEPVD